MDSLNKSFKSQNSCKSNSSSDLDGDSNPEEQHVESAGHLEVILNVDDGDVASTKALDPINGGSKIWRGSSYEFWKNGDGKILSGGGDDGEGSGGFDFGRGDQSPEDPPSKLIGQFLLKQQASGDCSLDMNLEMEELQNTNRNSNPKLPSVSESPKDVRVSFSKSIENDSVRRRFKNSPQEENRRSVQNIEAAEILTCTSNASFKRDSSFQRKSSLLKTKTKSRLMDPPENTDKRSGRVAKSSQLKSGFIGKSAEDEEDDPLLEGDVPEEYKKANSGVMTLIQWVSLVLIIGALICSLTIPVLKKFNMWNLKLWKWEVMILVLICGRLVSGWGIRIVVFFIERNFLLRKRVLYFVYGVRKAVQNCLWLGLVLIAWNFLFDKKVERETNSKALGYVTKILVCLLVGTLLWLVKTLIVKVLASSFHVSTYFDRIQESLFNQYVIETLSGPPLIEIKKIEEEEERVAAEVQKLQNAGVTLPPDLSAAASTTNQIGRVQKSPRGNAKFSRTISKNGDEGITIDHLHKLNPKNISAWNMKRLMNIVRYGDLSTLDEQIQDSKHKDESAKQISSEFEAKAAARKIFRDVAKPGSKYIYMEDLMRFMVEDESSKTMSLFEGASETKKISKSSLKNWVVNAFRERRALALTLNDTKTAVNKLHHMVNVLVGIVLVVIWLLILGIATSKLLLFVSSQLLLVAFIFGNTCKTIFEALIFLFVMHPIDVGDRCEIDGVQMVVEEMNILNTVFLRYDNQKIMYPNSVLSAKPISNYYRSPDMGDAVDFCIHISTPADKIASMKQRITSYVENKSEHWYPAPKIILKDVEELNKVRIAVWLTHRMNHQDMGERWVRRNHLVEEMIKIFKELDIQYRLLPLDINIRAMPPVTTARLPSTWTGPTN